MGTHLEGGYLKLDDSVDGKRLRGKLRMYLLEETFGVAILRYAEEPCALI